MKPQAALEQLEQAASKLGVHVSYEALSTAVGGGGLCRVKGKYRVIIDKRAAIQDRVSTLASALAALDTSALELPEQVGGLVEFYRARQAS